MAIIPVNVHRDDHYLIQIKIGSLVTIGQRLEALKGDRQIVIISDNNVENLYAYQLLKILQDSHISAKILSVHQGEISKSIDVAFNLIERLLQSGVKRRDLILALGGGVITDLAGFVAATYMRGIPYINIPTTLLAQLDASIGGKVAVNHRSGKNLIGAFYHPSAVYIDPETLTTLPREEVCNGLAEAIKVAVIHSQELFEFIEINCEQLLRRDIPLLAELVTLSARAKVELLKSDPYEIDLRRVLNFGHSIGHVLETLSGYNQKLSHGQAISIGMATATRIAAVKGICQAETAERILALLQKAELPTQATEINISSLKDGLQVIRAIRDGSLNLVLPTQIGDCTIVSDLPLDFIVENVRVSNY